MSDDAPFYAPGRRIPERQSRPGEPLWEFTRNLVTYACELRDFSPYGFEAQVLRDGDLFFSRRWRSREAAIAWGDRQRADLASGADGGLFPLGDGLDPAR